MVGVIQFSDYNGNNKGDFVQVPSSYLFGITLDSYVVFFGDWDANTISYAHKLDPDSPALIIKSNLTAIVDGMELVSPDKQAPGKDLVHTLGFTWFVWLNQSKPCKPAKPGKQGEPD